MTDHAFVLNNITLMTPDLEKQLKDFLNAGLQNISFQEYTHEVCALLQFVNILVVISV